MKLVTSDFREDDDDDIYCDEVSVSLCLMKKDHFLNFVKARFGCVLYIYVSKSLNGVVTRIFSLGFMDGWPKSGQKRGNRAKVPTEE